MGESCYYCGRERPMGGCRNTTDMEEDNGDKVCFAAMMIVGGGTRTVNRVIAEQLRQSEYLQKKRRKQIEAIAVAEGQML